MTNFELFLERKYPRGRGYFVCSKCQKVRDKKTIKQSPNTKNKKRNRYKHTIDRFKVVADKDMRKMSNIVKNLIRRYVESRV